MTAFRFLEIDALRGLAVIIMVVYHFLFDYTFFISSVVDLSQGFWFFLGRAAAVIFIALVGVSLTLHAHRKNSATIRANEWKILVRRGITILCLGLLISLATFILFPAYAVWFGALHLIGFSLVASAPFVHRRRASLLVGSLIAFLGVLFSTVFSSTLPFWPILLPVSFQTFDYFPLFPWFGIFLLGIAAGHYFYPHGVPLASLGWKSGNAIVRVLAWLGRKSLVIYFVHQPILLGIIWMLANFLN